MNRQVVGVAAILVASSIGVGLAVYLRSGPRGHVAAPLGDQPSGPSAAAVEPDESRDLVALHDSTQTDDSVEVAPPSGALAPPKAALALGIDADPAARVKLGKETFEPIYRDWTLTALMAQKSQLELDRQAFQEEVVEGLLAAGQCEEFIVEQRSPEGLSEDEYLKPREDVPPWPPSKNMTTVVRTESLDDGTLRLRRTVIPYPGFEDYYRMTDELHYLVSKIHMVKQETMAK